MHACLQSSIARPESDDRGVEAASDCKLGRASEGDWTFYSPDENVRRAAAFAPGSVPVLGAQGQRRREHITRHFSENHLDAMGGRRLERDGRPHGWWRTHPHT